MNLEFDDSERMHPRVRKQERDDIRRCFINRVNRKLALQTNAPLNRFSLKCRNDVGPDLIIGWISNVLRRRVSELVLHISSYWDWPLSSEIDVSETAQEFWESCSVSSTSLKRLTLRFEQFLFHKNHKSVSFDTPNLVYFEYSDVIADEYPVVNFDLLVGACLDLRMKFDQIERAKHLEEDFIMPDQGRVGNAADLLMGIHNVKTLYLSDNTLEVFNFCCEPMPVYNNLIHLTIKTARTVGWESLPGLLKNCPNLETLVFEGLLHRIGFKCPEYCLCKAYEEENIPICLSSSPVKVLKILKFEDVYEDEDEDVDLMEQVKYFLETMPNLEQLILHYDRSWEVAVADGVYNTIRQFQMVPREGLAKCEIKLIPNNLS